MAPPPEDPAGSGGRLPDHPLGPGVTPARTQAAPALPEGPAPRWVDVAEITDDRKLRLRPVDAVGPLAESVARLGQREPVDLRPLPGGGFQLVAGQRRLAAVRLLHRRWILARVHEGLADADALLLALLDDLDRRPWSPLERSRFEERLAAARAAPPQVAALLARAAAHTAEAEDTSPTEAAQSDEEEIEIDALADRVRDRLADACNDLSSLYEVWQDLDEDRRAELIECVSYLKDMFPFLTGAESEET